MEPFKENQPYIAYLFFAGYFAGQASWVTVEFLRESQTPLPPIVHLMQEVHFRPSAVYNVPTLVS